MIKYVFLFFNTIALLIYQLFFTDGITITQIAPPSAKIGGTFTVELVIKKGDVDGFAKLQQDLPDGFTAEEGTTNGASFTFSNNSVKFIWMALPADKEFKVTYKVKIDNTVIPGDKFISGKFSYIVNNAKQQVEIAPATINIPSEVAPVANEPLATSPTANPDDNLVSISGTYLDDKDMPIQGLKVNLKSSAGIILQTTTTDNTGFFAFSKLPKDNTDIVALDETDTHLIGRKSKAETKDNKGVVIETKDLTGNAAVAGNTTEPAATTEPVAATTQPTTNGVDNSMMVCSRKMPENITDNNSFDVELTLVKGNISGFAKCVEVLPAGFTASAIETSGSTFTFADNKVKFVWVSLPAATTMKVSYKITVAPGMSGPQVVDGVFSFIENDETRKCTFNTNTVNIGPAGTQPAAATTTEPAKTTEPVATTTQPEATKEPVVPYQPEAVKEPVAVTQPETVKEPVVNPTQPEAVKEPVAVTQPEAVKEPVVKQPEPVKESTAVAVNPVQPEPVVAKTEPVNPVQPEPAKVNPTEPSKTESASAANNNPALAATSIPAPNGNVSYAVQIAALRNAKAPMVLASYFKINEKPNIEMADGLTKYTVGSHKVYKEAHDARNQMKSKVPDAWVTSYNKGKRITVQEALMISAQKWYK